MTNTVTCTGWWDCGDGVIDSNWQLTQNGIAVKNWGFVNTPIDADSFDVTDDVAQQLIDGDISPLDVI